jgi:hypothetical protein
LAVGEDVDLQAWRGTPLPLASRDLNERLQTLFEAELERPA